MPNDHDFSEELAVALKEQAFGIASFEIVQEHAVIRLLDENRMIVVKVSERGWEVLDEERKPVPGQRYATLDDLLRANSRTYAAKEKEVLFGRLAALAAMEHDLADAQS